ncbi:athila retroelement ORF1 protein, putative [Medicago truncatula]|uniref:Athila retroelement ORF1 protein, putative n=1 Tax=Medicago truncatula TaxID=3880 RepID=A0A072UV94_MEDTR|nr:athila retroelement ORF1 protein, putative [Medicago truncatula]
MRGRGHSVDLHYDPEIERTPRANWKAVRLSKSVPPSARTRYTSLTLTEPESIQSPKSNTMGDVDPPPRPKMGDYGLAANCGRLTHVFKPTKNVVFDIKTSIQNHLKDRHFDGSNNVSPHEHLSHFAKTCEFCVPPATVTDDQKKLRLFPFTLARKAKDWMLTLPNGTIQTWDELELKFLEIFFPKS